MSVPSFSKSISATSPGAVGAMRTLEELGWTGFVVSRLSRGYIRRLAS
jgi:predicted HAD superfamily phosphohydrolase